VRRQVLVLLLEVFLVRSHRRVPLRGPRRLRRTHVGVVGVLGRAAVGVILRLRQRRLVVLLRLVHRGGVLLLRGGLSLRQRALQLRLPRRARFPLGCLRCVPVLGQLLDPRLDQRLVRLGHGQLGRRLSLVGLGG